MDRLRLLCALALVTRLFAAEHSYRIVHVYPHDRTSYTEGLVYYRGFLYESTGLEKHSVIRKIQLETGRVIQEYVLPPEFFGEGIAILGEKMFGLTYRTRVGFVYDLKTFKVLDRFSYEGEGWALTTDGRHLYMSDGSSSLQIRDPKTLAKTGTIAVRDSGWRVDNLNELEYVEGEIYANVWHSERIARISPLDGRVTGWIDLAGILKPEERPDREAVLNGIAYDAVGKRLFVTGKYWPKLFEIKVVPKGR